MSHQTETDTDMTSRRTVFPGRQLIHLWGNACAKDLRGGSLSTVPGEGLDGAEMPGAVLKSYATPIANRLTAEIRTPGGERVFLISQKTYSKTTAKQIGFAWNAIPLRSDFEVSAWEGRAETLPQLPRQVSAKFSAFIFTVPRVRPSTASEHGENVAALHAAAVAELEGLRKAVKYGNPDGVGAMFATADYYRRTFTPEAAPLPLPADTVAVITAFRARLAKSEARAKAEAARLHSARTAWLEAYAGTAEAIRRAYFATLECGKGDTAATLAEKVTAWEAGNPWPAEGDHSAELEAVDTLRRTVRALLAGRAEGCRAYVPVPATVRAALPCPATVCLRGEYPQAKREHGTGAPFWEACGLSAYNVPTWGRPSATREAGRALVRLTADGAEVITSEGARVPASIARALWKRHGDLMRQAATAEAAPAFPGDGAGVAFGPFNWNGWEAASPEAAASGGGRWALRVGCHRIAAADLCRLADRNAWEGACK